jgi:hypothetical protein
MRLFLRMLSLPAGIVGRDLPDIIHRSRCVEANGAFGARLDEFDLPSLEDFEASGEFWEVLQQSFEIHKRANVDQALFGALFLGKNVC